MGRASLRAPIGELIDDSLADEHVQRLWRGIQERRQQRRARARPIVVFAIACLLASLGAVAFLLFRNSAHSSSLRLADGHDVPLFVVAPQRTLLSLDDGSNLEIGAGSVLDVLVSDQRAFTLALRKGNVTFDVRPGGQRTWRIECGRVAVEVVGTRFAVERTEEAVRVVVVRGAVLVSGDAVPDRVVRLGAGQSLEVSEPRRPEPRSGDAVVPPAGASAARVRKAPEKAQAEPVASPSTAAPEAPKPNAEALFSEADAARRGGRFSDAIALLQRIIAEHPGDSRVPLANFTLGRIHLDSLSKPDQAAKYFRRALEHGLPAALAEDARARIVEANTRAGNGQAARDAAAEYRALYPNGRRLPEVERWSLSAP